MACRPLLQCSQAHITHITETSGWRGGGEPFNLQVKYRAYVYKYQTYSVLQQFASKHKPQTFSRVFLRLKRGVYRWKLKCFTAHVTCHSEKP